MPMELRHLTTFLAIVDSGTLTGAARGLYKTQGAVSQDLKMLEAELGVQLIDRSGQRVKLTPAGTALFPLASQVVHGVRKVEIEMSRVKRGEREVVRVGALPSLSLNVSQFLLSYREDNPGLRWPPEN
jgi:DNA-binding transcriptional LysR family regulator